MRKLHEVLRKQEDNYILPFFWQHGEEENVLREYMQKINESGIKAVCIESRPHPDFVGPKWWEDLDVIMDEARKRNMKVWILDDSHFPTGYAVGKIKQEYPHLQKLFLKVQQQDFIGPQKNAGFLVKWATHNREDNKISVGVDQTTSSASNSGNLDDEIIGIIAAKKISMEEVDVESIVDISQHLHNGVVYWNLPEGDWRIFTLVKTRHGGEKATEGYLNPIVPEATQVLIDTVYEPHLHRYKEDFGSTFAGFFSDEPRFGNVKGPFASIGRCEMVLPWREDMLDILQKRVSDDILRFLPLLWVDAETKAHEVRYAYMDTVSQLYADNFTGQLGSWCRKHGVEYIGHLMEDNNAHARLGYGAGHFYRGLWEQDMSGIDVVLNQIMPGMDKGVFKSFTATGWDGEFFHYGLAKMGASLGHIDPKKKGRTMCEVYGAYGWGEGLKLMKWITDHMLVRGVNYFVPHAFSAKDFPDPDCPPHFYANGKDPQYRYMNILMNYMNRMSHLLTDGTHIAPVAVLYHAEAEWSGDYMLFQKPARELTQHQIDFDVIPMEIVTSSKLTDGKLLVNDEQFSCLVVPYAEALPKDLIATLLAYVNEGFRVVFIDGLPQRSSEGLSVNTELVKLKQHEKSQIVSLENLATQLKSEGIYDIAVSNAQPYLRYYHYRQQDGDVFMFFNENPYKAIETTIEVPLFTKAYIYNAFENKLSLLDTNITEHGTTLTLSLETYESKVIIFGDSFKGENVADLIGINKSKQIQELKGKWQISFATAEQYPEFTNHIEQDELTDLSAPSMYPDFSGTVKYEIDFDVMTAPQQALLAIKEAYEIVDIWLNDQHIGTKICPPYQFDVTNVLKEGTNHLVIEVTNTLVKDQKDFLSQYLIQEPTGILGSVDVVLYQ
ncbi:glycosyl hydrolase [Priestia megaterium]|uniref:glycosyl hydrolase n=1 Tax=Priestia megaterium TaxID=1404 RepID=UPI0027954ACA|nr:glycosyl hydrolase [Priestia megaterium]